MNRKLILRPRYDTDSTRPLMADLDSLTGAPTPIWETGDKLPLVLQFVEPNGTGDALEAITLETGDTIVVGAKLTPASTTLLFTATSFSATTLEGETAYTGTLDLTTIPTTTWQGRAEVKTHAFIQVRDAANTIRFTRRFTLQLNKGLYNAEPTEDPTEPFLDAPTADNRYLAYHAAQTLTSPQQTQAQTNLGGTTTGRAIFTTASSSAARATLGVVIGTNVQAYSANLSTLAAITPGGAGLAILATTTTADAATAIGLGTADDVTHGSLTSTGQVITNSSFDAINANTGATTSYGSGTLIAYDLLGAETYAFFGSSGAATLTGDLWLGAYSGLGQGWLMSRTGLFGYRPDGGNTIVLDPETGTAEVTTLIVTGTINGNVTLTGTLIVGNVNASALSGTSLTLENDGSITQGGYTLTLGGNVAFTATGRALATAADAAAAFADIKQDATATDTGVVREWFRSGICWLTALTENKSATAGASTSITSGGYELNSGTVSSTAYAQRRIAASNQNALAVGKAAGVIPWASGTIECEVLINIAALDAGAVFRLFYGRTTTYPTGDTAFATMPNSLEIRVEPSTALKVICATASALTSFTTSFTPTVGITFRLRWKATAGTVTVFVNDALVGTNTGGPTADSGITANVFSMGVENVGTVSGSSAVKTSVPVLDPRV